MSAAEATTLNRAARRGLAKAAKAPLRQIRKPNPLAYVTAIQGAHKLRAHDQLTRAARASAAVDLLAQSKATMQDWRDVADVINMVEAFAHLGLVRNARDFVAEQQASVAAALDRHKATGSNVLRPVEVSLLRDLVSVWTECLAEVTCQQYYAAEQRVVRKVQQALAKGSHGAVRVVEIA